MLVDLPAYEAKTPGIHSVFLKYLNRGLYGEKPYGRLLADTVNKLNSKVASNAELWHSRCGVYYPLNDFKCSCGSSDFDLNYELVNGTITSTRIVCKNQECRAVKSTPRGLDWLCDVDQDHVEFFLIGNLKTDFAFIYDLMASSKKPNVFRTGNFYRGMNSTTGSRSLNWLSKQRKNPKALERSIFKHIYNERVRGRTFLNKLEVTLPYRANAYTLTPAGKKIRKNLENLLERYSLLRPLEEFYKARREVLEGSIQIITKKAQDLGIDPHINKIIERKKEITVENITHSKEDSALEKIWARDHKDFWGF